MLAAGAHTPNRAFVVAYLPQVMLEGLTAEDGSVNSTALVAALKQQELKVASKADVSALNRCLGQVRAPPTCLNLAVAETMLACCSTAQLQQRCRVNGLLSLPA